MEFSSSLSPYDPASLYPGDVIVQQNMLGNIFFLESCAEKVPSDLKGVSTEKSRKAHQLPKL